MFLTLNIQPRGKVCHLQNFCILVTVKRSWNLLANHILHKRLVRPSASPTGSHQYLPHVLYPAHPWICLYHLVSPQHNVNYYICIPRGCDFRHCVRYHFLLSVKVNDCKFRLQVYIFRKQLAEDSPTSIIDSCKNEPFLTWEKYRS